MKIMIQRGVYVLFFALIALRSAAADPSSAPGTPPASPPTAAVTVENTRTSIYIGTVSLSMPSFRRSGVSYSSTYVTKVFPYFFYNESGSLQIDIPDADLARLAAGETITFTGNAQSTKGEPRRIEGRAVPHSPTEGKIKVRVFVTPKIELIFNTTYRFHN